MLMLMLMLNFRREFEFWILILSGREKVVTLHRRMDFASRVMGMARAQRR